MQEHQHASLGLCNHHQLTVSFEGRLHIDGGLLSVLTPPPGAYHSVLVCRWEWACRLPLIHAYAVHCPAEVIKSAHASSLDE
jgi:hypothetical protein